MRIARIFCTNKLQEGSEITLSAYASQHVLHALRLKLEAPLIVFNGTGGEFQASLIAVKTQRAIVRIQKFTKLTTESPLKIHLAQGIAKNEKMDFIIQKAIELGVTKIMPLFTEYCNVKLEGERSQKRLERWQNIAISACEQSGRDKIPTIDNAQNFTNFINQKYSSLNLLLSPRATTKATTLPKEVTAITMLIGPEGGFSNIEETMAQNNGFIPINLGPRILRTETATITALSILQTRWGDM
jgi:16S rRNA (uracil1498-N3)-methyltransferase